MSLINRIRHALFSFFFASGIYKPFVMICAKLMRIVAISGKGSNICLREGFLPVPVHFYSPIPDIGDLQARNIWDVRSELPGIDFRIDGQLHLLKEFGSRYGDECRWPLEASNDPAEFYIRNPSFSYGCAASTHSMIRYFNPNNIIEVGSGMSSRIISRAVRLNGKGTNYSIVDPFPSEIIRNNINNLTCLKETKVELLPPDFFSSLRKDDILFIDSSHSVKIGGDVNFLFLEVLPRLAPGVIIHIHDIDIPYEYPKAYATSETFRQFWTEQYLLQSFLCFNSEFEVLMAMNYIMRDHSNSFRESFPHYNPDIHTFISGSFWIRRKV